MTQNEKSKIRAKVIKWVTRLFLILVAIIMLYPLAWNVVSSFKTSTEFLTDPFAWPQGLAWDNYVRAYEKSNLAANIGNSIYVVLETLVIPMYGRKMCSQLYPKIYRDETALRLIDQVDYDFSALEEKAKSIMHRFGFLEVAMRQSDLAWEVRDYLKTHPNAAVVNLGCGLDDTGRACDNGTCKIYNIDFPDVIAVRNVKVIA